MVLIHGSSSFKHLYPKQTLWIYFISSNLFLLFSSMSVSDNLFIFLYFPNDLKYQYVLVPHEAFVGYDQNHHKRCWASLSWIGAIPNLVRISSFLIRYLFVWPHIQRNIRISNTLILWMCCPFVTQHSTSHIIAGLIAVM
jgi:hypothetical protein